MLVISNVFSSTTKLELIGDFLYQRRDLDRDGRFDIVQVLCMRMIEYNDATRNHARTYADEKYSTSGCLDRNDIGGEGKHVFRYKTVHNIL